MIRDFGVLLAVGVVVLVTVGIVVPAAILGVREWTKRTAGAGRVAGVERVVVKLGGLPTSAAPVFVIASVVLFVGGILVEGRTEHRVRPGEVDRPGHPDRRKTSSASRRRPGSPRRWACSSGQQRLRPDVIDLVHDFTLAAEERPEVVSTS